MLIDSHCHLNMLDLTHYNNDLAKLIEQSKQAGLIKLITVATELKNADEIIKIAERFPEVFASVGLHPGESCDQEPSVDEIVALAQHPKVVAIGETGLDYYYHQEGLEEMRERFRTHIRAAKILKKPLIIHSRQAPEDTIRILIEEKANEIGGVMHCFTEAWEMAEQAMNLGFYISFSGIITFKNATEVVEVAKKVPLERMLIETDAPYLTPIPFRGKPNAPHYVRYVAEKIAELKNCSFENVAEITAKNCIDLFRLC
jgi:TatD DNase family protein